MKVYKFSEKKLMNGGEFYITIVKNRLENYSIEIPEFQNLSKETKERYIRGIKEMFRKNYRDIPFIGLGEFDELVCKSLGISVDYSGNRKIWVYGGGYASCANLRETIKEYETRSLGQSFDEWQRLYPDQKEREEIMNLENEIIERSKEQIKRQEPIETEINAARQAWLKRTGRSR